MYAIRSYYAVQENDRLDIEKPCIDALDEGHNVEWSTELLLEEARAEYLNVITSYSIHYTKLYENRYRYLECLDGIRPNPAAPPVLHPGPGTMLRHCSRIVLGLQLLYTTSFSP